MEKRPSFEQTYPRYPFSELVRLAVAIARLIAARHRDHDVTADHRLAGTAS